MNVAQAQQRLPGDIQDRALDYLTGSLRREIRFDTVAIENGTAALSADLLGDRRLALPAAMLRPPSSNTGLLS